MLMILGEAVEITGNTLGFNDRFDAQCNKIGVKLPYFFSLDPSPSRTLKEGSAHVSPFLSVSGLSETSLNGGNIHLRDAQNSEALLNLQPSNSLSK